MFFPLPLPLNPILLLAAAACSRTLSASLIASPARTEGRSSLRLRHDTEIRLGRFPTLRITPLRFVVGDRTSDDDVLTRLPVDWSSDLMLRGQLQRVDHPQHLVEVPPRCHWIDQ